MSLENLGLGFLALIGWLAGVVALGELFSLPFRLRRKAPTL
jgi:hypothetical protein